MAEPEQQIVVAPGGAASMSETRAGARARGLRVREFEALWDVDHPAQIERLDALLAKAAP